MSEQLKPCPFCQCAMQIKTSYGGQMVAGDHSQSCVFYGSNSAAFCLPGQDLLDQMVERWNTRAADPQIASARGSVSNALNLVGQIRQGSNIPAQELWDACEYLDKALEALPRPA